MAEEGAKRIDHFNTMVGLIFAQLYEQFPLESEIDQGALADAMGVSKEDANVFHDRPIYNFGKLPSGDQFYSLMVYSLKWLREEEFIRAKGENADRHVVLTSKALVAMNAVPPGLKHQDSLGSQLVGAAKGAGRNASNAAIGDIVGQIIGAGFGLAKGLF